jgi:hypothetical protein
MNTINCCFSFKAPFHKPSLHCTAMRYCCLIAGDTTKATDPYFPFEDAVDVWGRTFAGLGITYQGSVMTLDLCDRQGKYSNGFCHWPQVIEISLAQYDLRGVNLPPSGEWCSGECECQAGQVQQRLLPLTTGAAECLCIASFA